MNRVDRIVEHAEQHCKSHGGRLTVKRKQVLSRTDPIGEGTFCL